MAANDMNTELVCIMASLGYYDGEDYFKGVDCLASLKDLARFLRREDESCNIRRQMGNAQLLQKDLLPILMHVTDDEELTDITIRLLVNLTSPADICFNKTPNEAEEAVSGKTKVTNTHQAKYLEVVQYLQNYKEAFTNEKVMAACASQIGKILQMEWEDRSEDQMILFERLLLLLRNILHVPSSPDEEKRTDDDASLHDQILWNLHVNGIDDLIIYVTSSPDEGRWVMHAAEIVNLMLREQNPEILAKTSKDRSEDEKSADTRALLNEKEKEETIRNESKKKLATTRHSRFGGTFWVKNLKGVGDKNTLVHHRHVKDINDISFDHNKYQAKKAKRDQDARETTIEIKSTLSIRLFLKDFCMKFLEHSYNSLMRIVKDNVTAKRTQENDDSYYLWILRFFMAFNRSLSFKVEYISETLNMNAFHYILKQLNAYYDQFFMHKRGGWEPWQKRLHLALQAYKELLTYLSNMDKTDDSVLKDASSMMKNNVFYHEEYRSVFLLLLRHFQHSKQTKKYLTDLVDTFHIFVRLLENFCGKKGSLIIKTKKKVAKRRKKKSTPPVILTGEQLDELWEDDLAPSLSSMLQGNEIIPDETVSPFDATSDVPVDEQSIVAMVRIQDHLRAGRCGEAIALLRAARECWPEESKFGGPDMSPEDEFGIVRNILVEELERPAFMVNNDGEDEGEEENEVEEEEIEESRTQSVEKEFNLKSFLTSLATPSILIPYNILLKNFEKNSITTNHAVVKMMHRVAVDMKFPEMLFQLSTFIIFKKVIQNKSVEVKELSKFAKYIINKFVSAAKENPSIYVEVLFWKGTGDCYEISNRDDELSSHTNKNREKWSFEEEEELRTLYDQYKETEDVVGEILKNITNTDRTRRQLTSKLVRLRLVENARQLPKPKTAKPPKWSEEQTEELHRIYEEMKGTIDPVLNIMNALSFPKSKQAIIKHLVETNKVSDKSELKKQQRRQKKNQKNNEFKDLVNEQRNNFGGDYVSDHWSSEGSDNDQAPNEPKTKAPISNNNKNNDIERKKKKPSYLSSSDSSDVSDVSDLETSVDETADRSINDLIATIKSQGYSQQLLWLQTRLRRAAEGREEDPEDDWCPVPLLTMTEDDENALQNKSFKLLLKKLKLKPPADEQEAFWRIPANLTPDELKENASMVEKSGVDSENNPSKVSNDDDRSEIQQQQQRKIKRNNGVKKSKKRRQRSRDSSDVTSDEDDDKVVERSRKRKKKLKIQNDSSEDEVETNGDTFKAPTTLDIDDSVPLRDLLHDGNHTSAGDDLNTQLINDDIPLRDLLKNNDTMEVDNTDLVPSPSLDKDSEPSNNNKDSKNSRLQFNDTDSDDSDVLTIDISSRKKKRANSNNSIVEVSEQKNRSSIESDDNSNVEVSEGKNRLSIESDDDQNRSALNFSLRLSEDESDEIER